MKKFVHFSQDSSLVDIIHLFFNYEIFELIQRETNLYAEQQINKKRWKCPLKVKSLYTQWKKASVQEIKLFFAVIIHMCYV
jgi:hypothetical protein